VKRARSARLHVGGNETCLWAWYVRSISLWSSFALSATRSSASPTELLLINVEILTAGVHVGDHSSRELGRLLSTLTQLLLERCNLLDVNELARAGGAIRVAAGPRKKPSSPG
jgi:hypothetical protein